MATICLPAGLLYLRLVLGLAASDSRVGPKQALWLARLSIIALVLFFISQVICARYVQNLFPPRESTAGKMAQYAAVLVKCILLSLTGAIVLEAFGLNAFLRAGFR
ncbi:MAG: hypothetical protein M3Y72_23330 [Acidobacteriota bacterium]|nr:hypothetical protein [Acidobacteriota bacterium]